MRWEREAPCGTFELPAPSSGKLIQVAKIYSARIPLLAKRCRHCKAMVWREPMWWVDWYALIPAKFWLCKRCAPAFESVRERLKDMEDWSVII